MNKEMTLEDVTAFIRNSRAAGIDVWFDGGWGVDALLGHQTRTHSDVDIAVELKDESKLRELLESQGFKDVRRDDTEPWVYALGDDKGHEIDFHVIKLDERGDGIYGRVRDDIYFPASSLTGQGEIGGIKVKCVSAEDAIKFHTGYKVDKNDYKDVKALCDKFGLDLPKEYEKFEK